jgi:hypothetical protein
MKEAKVYSFSVNNKPDKDLVDELKAECKKYGKNFSHMMMEALRELKANRSK